MTSTITRSAAALAAVAALVVAGCGSSGGSSSSATQATTKSPASSGPATMQASVPIQSFKFVPATVTVKAGGKVTWTNKDSAPHTASADNDGGFDTGSLKQGQSKTLTFAKAGTYAYHCAFHAFMKGTVVVR